MAKTLLGKELVAALGEALSSRVDYLADLGIDACLAIVRVGERPDDLSYERTAMKRAEALGIKIEHHVLPEEATTEDLLEVVRGVNESDSVHACLLFRPLPKHIDEDLVCNSLIPGKDIDGISALSLAKVFMGSGEGFPPATAQACLEMLSYHGIDVSGKHVVVIGRSLVIGKPVAMMLLERNATVTICHSRTENLEAVCQSADVVICATGRARAYGASYFRPGQVVLDVGINFDEAGKLCGDVNFDEVEPIVGAITPVPGGLGSVTTSVTMAHVVEAAAKNGRVDIR